MVAYYSEFYEEGTVELINGPTHPTLTIKKKKKAQGGDMNYNREKEGTPVLVTVVVLV